MDGDLPVLCSGTGSQDAEADGRLAEAKGAFDEAQRFVGAGRYTEGIPRGESALALSEAVLGENHPELASIMDLAGELHRCHRDYARAEALFQHGLAILEAALGKDHPAVATSLHNLAELYRMEGRFARAEPLYQRALATREAVLSKHHPDVAATLDSLAELAWLKGQLRETGASH